MNKSIINRKNEINNSFSDKLTEDIKNIEILEKRKYKNLEEYLKANNVQNLKYIKCGSYGHTFKLTTVNNKNFVIKMVPYIIKNKDKKEDYLLSKTRPENVEILILSLLNEFLDKEKSPHIMFIINTFYTDIYNFINIQKIDDARYLELYKKFVINYNKKKFHNKVSIIISEWANGGDLLQYIKNNQLNFLEIKSILFQLLYTLAIIQNKYPSFKHNDLKTNNILITVVEKNCEEYIQYIITDDEDKKYIFNVNNVGLNIKIWDFDFASIDNLIINEKLNNEKFKERNITSKKNRYYDLHYFFITFFNLEIIKEYCKKYKELNQFYNRVVPEKYKVENVTIDKRGRLLKNIEYTIPIKIIKHDQFFEEFRDE